MLDYKFDIKNVRTVIYSFKSILILEFDAEMERKPRCILNLKEILPTTYNLAYCSQRFVAD